MGSSFIRPTKGRCCSTCRIRGLRQTHDCRTDSRTGGHRTERRCCGLWEVSQLYEGESPVRRWATRNRQDHDAATGTERPQCRGDIYTSVPAYLPHVVLRLAEG